MSGQIGKWRHNFLNMCVCLTVHSIVCYKLEGHLVEHMYLRQRYSDGSVNKTILKPRLAVAVCRQWDFSYVKFSVAALYDIGESNPVLASGLWSRLCSKVNQFVHVPTSVDTQHLIYPNPSTRFWVILLTDRQTDKHGQIRVFPPLSEVKTIKHARR